VEVADDGHIAACGEKALLDFGNGGRGFGDVDGPANDFGAGFGEFERLFEGGGDVGSVRVGHGLDDDGRAAADLDVADLYAVGFAARVARAGGIGASDLGKCGHLYKFNKNGGTEYVSRLEAVLELALVGRRVEVAEGIFD